MLALIWIQIQICWRHTTFVTLFDKALSGIAFWNFWKSWARFIDRILLSILAEYLLDWFVWNFLKNLWNSSSSSIIRCKRRVSELSKVHQALNNSSDQRASLILVQHVVDFLLSKGKTSFNDWFFKPFSETWCLGSCFRKYRSERFTISRFLAISCFEVF